MYSRAVEFKKVRCRFIVWYLARSAICPISHNLPPGHRTCLFISHLNSPGSIQPGCHSGAQNYSNTQAFTVLPGIHLSLGQESARVSKVPCIGAQRRSIVSAAGDWTRDLSHVRRARYHWTTTPHQSQCQIIVDRPAPPPKKKNWSSVSGVLEIH